MSETELAGGAAGVQTSRTAGAVAGAHCGYRGQALLV